MRSATLEYSQSLVNEDFTPRLSRKHKKKTKLAPVHDQLHE